MISSSFKKLSRLEITYSIVKKFIKVIDQNILPENFKPYIEEALYNDAIYSLRDKDLKGKIKRVLKDGLKLYFFIERIKK